MSRYRISYSKEGAARFMSHLDLVRTFDRAVRRAGLPVSMSQGYNPHTRMAFAFPLPVGVAGLEEYMDIDLDAEVSPEQIVSSLGRVMPGGLRINGACPLEDRTPALMAEVERSFYRVRASREDLPGLDTVRECMEGLLARTGISVVRRKKDGGESVFDIRPGIMSLSAREEGDFIVIEMELMSGSSFNVRPGEVISILGDACGIPAGDWRPGITRTRMLGRGGKELFTGCS